MENEKIKGYEIRDEIKKKKHETLYFKTDNVMASKLMKIRDKTGISVSELIRESVRRMVEQFERENEDFRLTI